jgi:hypothetical protein
MSNTDFIWVLPEAGHLVAVAQGAGAIILPKEHSRRATERWIRYTPLHSNPGLFRAFADIDRTQESIVAFADRFGLLKDPEGGEPLATWRAAIIEMKSAVECWEEAQKANAKPPQILSSFDIQRIAALEQARAELQEQLISMQGEVFLQGNVSASTSEWESVASKLNQNISHVRPVFVVGPMKDGLSVQLMPTNLLEAMWPQFGQAVESNRAFRKCPQCVTWFDISHKAGRFDKVFCSGACKAKAYRGRLARQHHAELRTSQSDEFAARKP